MVSTWCSEDNWLSLSTMWVTGVERTSSGLVGRSLYLLTCPTSPSDPPFGSSVSHSQLGTDFPASGVSTTWGVTAWSGLGHGC